MMTRTRWLLTAAVIVGGAAMMAAAFPFVLRSHAVQHALVVRGFNRAMRANAARAALVAAPELRVVLCGTASPIPSAFRAGPCAAIIVGGRIYLVDAGGGGWRNMMLWHMPGERLAAVLLTHFHSDHIEDLGEVNLQSWAPGRQAPLAVYGGPGVVDVVGGFNAAYAHDDAYRVAHHGAAVLPPDAAVMAPHTIGGAADTPLREGETAAVLDAEGLKITAIGVAHFPVVPAYAYRFDYGGRSAVISGDTRESPGLAAAATATDVLVHEAQSNDLAEQLHVLMAERGFPRIAKILRDIQSYHTTPAQAAHIANLAGAKLLVLTHLTPAVPAYLSDAVFLAPTETIRPRGSMVGFDGLLISLPPNSDAIEIGDLF